MDVTTKVTATAQHIAIHFTMQAGVDRGQDIGSAKGERRAAVAQEGERITVILRRYSSPVVIQNAGQVNVAADGGQQTNIQRKAKKKTKAKVATPARSAIRLARKQ